MNLIVNIENKSLISFNVLHYYKYKTFSIWKQGTEELEGLCMGELEKILQNSMICSLHNGRLTYRHVCSKVLGTESKQYLAHIITNAA